MTSLNKFIVFLALNLCVSVSGFAGEAILFDDPGLIGYRNDGRIYGFYGAVNSKFSCMFFFFQDENSSRPSINGYTDTGLLTFVPSEKSFEFSDRDKTFDINGDLYRSGDEWVIKTSTGQAGCENSTGGFIFNLGSLQAARYYVVKKIPAIGIRLVIRKSYLYDFHDEIFSARKSYLTKWNAVVVVEARGQFSLIRFSDPRLNAKSYGKVTTGWIHSEDLVDPFPLASKEPKQ